MSRVRARPPPTRGSRGSRPASRSPSPASSLRCSRARRCSPARQRAGVGAEALARFRDSDDEAIPTERCFLDAHAVGLGVALELSVIALALGCQERLPDGRYLALNVSPAVLEHAGLIEELERREIGRPLVVELTEHQPVEDYVVQLDRLRALGIRVAVDDVGSGFSSFRHVTRVNPDILKLDRTLVCGIDDDPVRRSLASAIDTHLPDLTVVG